jgi:Predicted SAM-dependent methyltransferases
MQRHELEERIAAFPRWHYRFEFDEGVSTPVSYRGQINRHEQRRRYFFDALLRVTGGSLAGRRVLDLGCNAGFWSLQAVEAGADFVLGVDGVQTYVDQANLVFEAKGVEPSRFRFEQGNIFTHEFGERFDIVLCLGLMDHVSKPVELFELISGVGAQLVVIDTTLSHARSSLFEVSSVGDLASVVDYPLVLLPTRQAVIELATQFDFDAVPLAHQIEDYLGLNDYEQEGRLAFICSKDASLEQLPRAKPPSMLPWWAATLARKATARLSSN